MAVTFYFTKMAADSLVDASRTSNAALKAAPVGSFESYSDARPEKKKVLTCEDVITRDVNTQISWSHPSLARPAEWRLQDTPLNRRRPRRTMECFKNRTLLFLGLLLLILWIVMNYVTMTSSPQTNESWCSMISDQISLRCILLHWGNIIIIISSLRHLHRFFKELFKEMVL